MATLTLPNVTLKQFQRAALEFGKRVRPYFLANEADTTKVITIHVNAQKRSGKSVFLANAAEGIQGEPISVPPRTDTQFQKEWSYSQTSTQGGHTLQAIFIDVCGMVQGNFSHNMCTRQLSGPLFLQHADLLKREHIINELDPLDAHGLAKAADIVVDIEPVFTKREARSLSPNVRNSKKRHITITTTLPNFPAEELVRTLKQRGITASYTPD
ncbi:MAG: hypothetical protein EB059_05250 [Alphaproteobacteria bacterium]|nr:hypothetical protein [Alphaproteobacteria bacterium]